MLSLFGNVHLLRKNKACVSFFKINFLIIIMASSASVQGSVLLHVYVAGESIERRNSMTEAPFTATGTLNDASNNDDGQYGWMIPLSDRLHLRNSLLTLQFIGADPWTDAEDEPYSGTYPSNTPEYTSAISGSSVDWWLSVRSAELTSRSYAYDVAFASRGGNDFDVDDDTYKTNLKTLIDLLVNGSSSQTNPIVYVTGHMPDTQATGVSTSSPAYHRYVERTQDAVNEYLADHPTTRVHFIDMYSPFMLNQPTTAFPSPTWSSGGVIDILEIGRIGDTLHPRRLASIYAGEIVADALDINELLTLSGFFTLTPSAGSNGTIVPSSEVSVASGNNTNFVITAAPYYHIAQLLTNGSADGAAVNLSSYTSAWNSVNASGTIHADFAENLTTNTQTPERWLAEHGFTNNFEVATTNDADGDGIATADEYTSDTNPTNSDSYLRLENILIVGGNSLQWSGGTGVIQYVEWTPNITNTWNVLATNTPPTPITNSAPFVGATNEGFYRIRAVR